MKTGLITFHAAHHYGAMLQTYGLAKTVTDITGGCDVIDYVRPDTLEAGRLRQRGTSPKTLAKNIHSLAHYSSLKRRAARFDAFMLKDMRLGPRRYLSFDELEKNPPEYDLYLSGSDQIWNPFIYREQKYDPAYFSFYEKTARKAAYAPSFGPAEIDGALAEELGRLLGGFSHLSAREKRGAEILSKVTGLDVPVVLDPTLLMTRDEWGKLADNAACKPYVLCYFVSPPGKLVNPIRRLKSRYGGCAVQLAGARRKAPDVDKMVFDAGPREFLTLFKNAAFVLTNSFHGVVFSVIFEKPFLCGAGGAGEAGKNSRAGNFLEMLELGDRLHDGEDASDIDYAAVEERLSAERGRSTEFLRSALLGEGTA
jgi:hypothetical protein